MRYVLDSSVALKWVLPEAHSAKAIALKEACRRGDLELLAPDVFLAETGHALARAERKNVIQTGEGAALFAEIIGSRPILRPSIALSSRAFEIASRMRGSFYDCLYVALSEEERCEFLTADIGSSTCSVYNFRTLCISPLTRSSHVRRVYALTIGN